MRPNVLIFHTDQQSLWTISLYARLVYGDKPLVETPNIDRIGKEGAVFTNFFANSAVCTPSRGCFLTGRYPHYHGAYKNNVPLNRSEITFAEILRRHGYETGYAGKWHLDGTPRPGWVHPERSMGFEHSEYMFNRGHWKKVEEYKGMQPIVYPYHEIGDERTYMTDWLKDKTIEFIQRPHTRPFCFMVSFPDPHPPYVVRTPYSDMYDPDDMPIPDTFRQKNLPRWADERQIYKRNPRCQEDWLRHVKAQYCGMVKLIDDCVGQILRCLEEQGILDETIIVFTTDHGDYMGEHGLMGKNMLYETVYHIPLLIRWPEKIRKGTVIEEIVSTVDFQQTLLGLIGIKPCGREQGNDASPLLRGEKIDWENRVFIYHSSHNFAGIITPDFELVYARYGESILFDRKNDPDQVNNLFNDPGYRKVIDELTKQLIEHHRKLNSPEITWLNAYNRS
ncbi:MAG: sulfatase-like hydrolase/transferase [Thermoprotei archaeon]|nr:sulfatase-like hydrolase/transferase [Thermoprotei archaeon]